MIIPFPFGRDLICWSASAYNEEEEKHGYDQEEGVDGDWHVGEDDDHHHDDDDDDHTHDEILRDYDGEYLAFRPYPEFLWLDRFR